jgi:hypothetical protein
MYLDLIFNLALFGAFVFGCSSILSLVSSFDWPWRETPVITAAIIEAFGYSVLIPWKQLIGFFTCLIVIATLAL